MGLPQIARSRRWKVFVDDTADEVPVICVPVVDSAMVLLDIDIVRFSAPLLPPSGLALPSDILACAKLPLFFNTYSPALSVCRLFVVARQVL